MYQKSNVDAEICIYAIENMLSSSKCFIMLVGVPGCGKTDFIKKYFPNVQTVNSGMVRREIFDGDPDKEFSIIEFNDEIKSRLNSILESGSSVIYDSSNCYSRHRYDILNSVEENCDFKIGIFLNKSLIKCLQELQNTSMPEEKIESMHWAVTKKPPSVKEGFNIVLEIDMNESEA